MLKDMTISAVPCDEDSTLSLNSVSYMVSDLFPRASTWNRKKVFVRLMTQVWQEAEENPIRRLKGDGLVPSVSYTVGSVWFGVKVYVYSS